MFKNYDEAISQLRKEIDDLKKTTTADLLMQHGKIAETVIYIKNNLSDYIKQMLSTINFTKEIDDIISEALTSSVIFPDVIDKKVNFQKNVFEGVEIKAVRNKELNISYIVMKINKRFKPHVNFTNGTNANPYDNHKSVIDYMQTANKEIAINAGLRGVTAKDGISHIEENTGNYEGFYILCIAENGTMVAVDKTYKASQIVNMGFRDCITIWSPIIEDGKFFDPLTMSSADKASENYDYIFLQRHPRQIVGTLEDGSYIVISVDGRMVGEMGATFDDLKQIVSDEGCVSAYNLDGGASTQTVIGKHLINRRLSESRTIGTVITFESGVCNNESC